MTFYETRNSEFFKEFYSNVLTCEDVLYLCGFMLVMTCHKMVAKIFWAWPCSPDNIFHHSTVHIQAAVQV